MAAPFYILEGEGFFFIDFYIQEYLVSFYTNATVSCIWFFWMKGQSSRQEVSGQKVKL